MKYRLYDGADNDISDAADSVLRNRGVSDCERYKNLDDGVLVSYTELGGMEDAVALFSFVFDAGKKISILVDTDPDGYCSAAMLYSYIRRMDADYPVGYIMHGAAKAHGLSGDVSVPDDTGLLVIPDAGTNDAGRCAELDGAGIRVLILDHHEREIDNPHAVIVNNQACSYPNKELSGAGIVYKFLQALDDEYWNDYADDYLDLCAVANISDVMDMRSYETRRIAELGLGRISNKCLSALIKGQEHMFGSGRPLTIRDVQWNITPLLNGCIRYGTDEDRDILFRALAETGGEFEYKKRGGGGRPSMTVAESIYDRAARLCRNAKARQDREREKEYAGMAAAGAEQMTGRKNLKALFLDGTDAVDERLTGLVATKMAESFHRPCIIYRRAGDGGGNAMLRGSARNFTGSPVESFKDAVNATGVMSGAGHANAFGISCPEGRLDEAAVALDDILKDIEYDPSYRVDFVFDCGGRGGPDDMESAPQPEFVCSLSALDPYIGPGIEPPMIAASGISLPREAFEVFGRNEDALAFDLCGVRYVQFKCADKRSPLYEWVQDAWGEGESVTFDIVGRPGMNDYGGVLSPQVVIEGCGIA